MIRNRLIVLSIFMMTVSPVMATDNIRWIYFTNKGIDPYHGTGRPFISERSLSRRRKFLPPDNLLSESDIPVSEEYIDSIRSTGALIRHRSRWLNAVSVVVSESQESSICQLPFVRDIKPVQRYNRIEPLERSGFAASEKTNSLSGLSYPQISQIGVDKLHSLGYTGEGILVCMIDTGFYKDHISLKNLHILAERDFVFHDNDTQRDLDNPEDYSDSHGTATWSAAGGYDPGEFIGPAYGASFILAKTEDLRYEQPIEEDNWIAAVEWADSIGTDIISSSLAYTLFDDGTGYSFENLDGNTAATTIVADRAAELGIAVVVAAGNYRTTGWGHIGTPADGDSVISVGAVDADGLIASFSSPGPTADGRTKPEVCARGINTYCATNASFGYTYKNGTSLSTPLVAGAAALLLEAHPMWSGADVRTALLNSASQWDHPNNDYGWGIIDAFLASGIEALFLEILTVAYDDDSLGESRGNGNGYVEAGETVEFSMSFINTGSINGGYLVGLLSSQDDRVRITQAQTSLSLGAPGDSATIDVPFVIEIIPDIQGNADIPLHIAIVTELSDTVFVSELSLSVHEVTRVAGNVRNIETYTPVSNAVVSVITSGSGYISHEITTREDGNFEIWLNPGTYSLFASKEGFSSVNSVLWSHDTVDTTLYLAQPSVSLPGSLLIAAIPDTSFETAFRILNGSNAPLTVSIQVQASSPEFTVSTHGLHALKSDIDEGFNPDIAAVYGRASPSMMDIITSFHRSHPLDGTYRLRIGIDTDDDDTNGLAVAGLNADHLIEVSNNAMLYEVLSGTWHFQTFLSIEQADSTFIISIPRDVLSPESTTIKMSMEIEIIEYPEGVGDKTPDATGSCPIWWSFGEPVWLLPDSSFVEIPPGTYTDISMHVLTDSIPTGTYHAELIIQGSIPEIVRIPVIMILTDDAPAVPDKLAVTTFYPNPFEDRLNIVVSVPYNGALYTRLIDLAGRSVQEWTPQDFSPGIHLYQLSIDASVASGVYMLWIRSMGDQTLAGPILR